SYATVSHEAAGNDALAKVEHLLHFGVSDDGFPVFGLEQTSHRFLHLIEQLINDAVKFDLDSFAFCSGNSHVLHLHIETDHYSIRSAPQYNVRFRNRTYSGMYAFKVDFLALDLLQRSN